MLLHLNKNGNFAIKIVTIIIGLFPVIFITYKLAETNKDSIVIFEDTSSIISIPILGFYSIFYVSIASLGIYWLIKQIKSITTLKNEKAKVELLHLKSQVNPHFFFNTLNNLYGLIGKENKKGQELILKLSEIMRYSIYEGENDTVPLSEERDYLKNYIALHVMRYHKKIHINFKEEIEANFKVMPLLFIILLENAFKHGVESLKDNAFVNIHLTTHKDELKFTIENNFDNSESMGKTGVGLKNLKRRLELVYPKNHKLSFNIVENIYRVELTLKRL